MNGIIGMTELTLDSDLTRSQRESLVLVHSLARSLLLIIDDILDISKSACAFSSRSALRQMDARGRTVRPPLPDVRLHLLVAVLRANVGLGREEKLDLLIGGGEDGREF